MTDKLQTIFRVMHDPDNPYVIMDKRPLEKPYISWKAKGLLAYLLSRPDDWKVRLGDLVKRSTDGGHATRQALRELIQVGHVRQVIIRTEDGRRIKEWVYEVYEQPLLRGFQQVDSQQVGSQQVENHTRTNIESSKKDSSKKEKKQIAAAPRATSFPEVVLFHAVTKRYPVEVNYQDVCAAVKKVNHRVGHVAEADDLLPFFKGWCARGFNPTNLGWLEWAISGKVPEQGKHGRAPVDEETRHARAKSKIQEFVESAS